MPCFAPFCHTAGLPHTTWRAATAALLLSALACTTGHAQVHRCTSAQGHTTYTNAPCAEGETAVLVQPALSAQEHAQQQAQYEQALQRREAERAARAQQEAAAQTQRTHEDHLRATQAAQAAAERASQAQAAAQAAADSANANANAPTVLPTWGGHGPAPLPPMYPQVHPPAHPPVHRPHPSAPHGDNGNQHGSGWSCNVFRCTDGQGNTRPVP